MPALLPPPMPTFGCSTSLACGNRSRTSSTVPSVEPLSTTTVSYSRTDSRHRPSQGSALYATTTTETSSRIRNRSRPPRAAAEIPQDDREPRYGQHERHHKEQNPAGERRARAHAQTAEEADEEGPPHRQSVDGERDEHDQEEQRAEHDVRQHRKVDP